MHTVSDVAKELGVSAGTVRRILKARAMDYMRVGRLVRVTRKALDEYKHQRTVKAAL